MLAKPFVLGSENQKLEGLHPASLSYWSPAASWSSDRLIFFGLFFFLKLFHLFTFLMLLTVFPNWMDSQLSRCQLACVTPPPSPTKKTSKKTADTVAAEVNSTGLSSTLHLWLRLKCAVFPPVRSCIIHRKWDLTGWSCWWWRFYRQLVWFLWRRNAW